MTLSHAPPLLDSLGLLERAVSFTRAQLVRVGKEDLWRTTPCADWDLAALLHHLEDSLVALTDAAEFGQIDLRPIPAASGCTVPVVSRLQGRAGALLAAWSVSPADDAVRVGDRPLRVEVLACAGALDVAVHGWDVSAALGEPAPLPPALARDLTPVARLLVGEHDRPSRFGAVRDVPRAAGPSERLLGFLGR